MNVNPTWLQVALWLALLALLALGAVEAWKTSRQQRRAESDRIGNRYDR